MSSKANWRLIAAFAAVFSAVDIVTDATTTGRQVIVQIREVQNDKPSNRILATKILNRSDINIDSSVNPTGLEQLVFDSLLYLSKGDIEKSVVYSANFGRDSDTIGTMCGSIAGAFSGSKNLKKIGIVRLYCCQIMIRKN